MLLSTLFGLSPLFVPRLILDLNHTAVDFNDLRGERGNGTLSAASLDLYATVGDDFDGA